MNAKDTIKKIADALNIGESEDKAKVEETQEVKAETAEEPKKAETTDTVSEEPKKKEVDSFTIEDDSKPADEPKDIEVAPESVEEPKAEVKQEKVEEVAKDEVKDDPRISKMQSQIDDLQKMLEAAVSSEAPAVEEGIQPLTHSPEGKPESNHKKIGGHGGTVLDRVYKYINN